MTTIVTRAGKGSPLTHTEVDTNFTNLNTAKLEAGAIALGSAAAPSISFVSDTNTGIFSPGADQVAISTNGTGRLFVDATGNVGVGTASPAYQLVVGQNAWIGTGGGASTGVGTPRTLTIAVNKTATDASPSFQLLKGFTSATATVGGFKIDLANASVGSPELAFYSGTSTGNTSASFVEPTWTERARITSAGLVGIGTSAPATTLDVNGDVTITDKIIHGGDTNTAIRFPAADTVAVETNGSERARIDSSGRLLVGTSTTVSAAGADAIQQIHSSNYMQLALINNVNAAGGCGLALGHSRGASAGTFNLLSNGDEFGAIYFVGADGTDLTTQGARISAEVDGTPGANDMPGRLVFSVTGDGSASPTERMRISSTGKVEFNTATANNTGTEALRVNTASSAFCARFFGVTGGGENAANAAMHISKDATTSRSINAGGTINASGADYAEYMTKAGDFIITKGTICGINFQGLITNIFTNAVSFVVKSTNPSYVGGDTWGSEDVVGIKPDAENIESFAKWKTDYESARRLVDRIAFAGQVPVNVIGATPGQYIVPIETANGGIEGIAKDETDLTLTEYMRAVGKVIAIEDDGRARIIVKVA